MGIEPTSQAWEARILPMNYTRIGLGYYSMGLFVLQQKSFDFFLPEPLLRLRLFCYSCASRWSMVTTSARVQGLSGAKWV